MFDWLRKRNHEPQVTQDAAPAAPKKRVPRIVPHWDLVGAPVIEPVHLALMDDEVIEASIEGFDESVQELLPQMRTQQDYAMLAMAFITVLELAKEQAVREAQP